MADLSFHKHQFRNKDSQNAKKRRRRDQLVLRYQPLVEGAANDIFYKMSRAIELEDLQQIGMLALVQAADKFEDRGVGFAAYAKLRVRGAMVDALRSVSDESRTSRSKRRELEKSSDALERQIGCKPSDQVLAKALGLNDRAWLSLQSQIRPIEKTSLDNSYSDHDLNFCDQSVLPDQALETLQQHDILKNMIETLSAIESKVLLMSFAQEMKLDAIGTSLGISAARVCQIRKKAINNLRQNVVSKMGQNLELT